MEVVRLKDEGVASVWSLKQAEYETAYNDRQREMDLARTNGQAWEKRELRMNPMPVWQRLTGLTVETEWRLQPFERRGALLRLARNFERMVRAEWKRVLVPRVGEERADPFADNEWDEGAKCRYATRTGLWNPVSEICFYLEIAQTKLSELLKQVTGLRAQDMSDCVRAEGLRATLKERIRKSARAWVQNEFMTKDYRPLAKMLAAEGQAIVMREYRASEGFMDRSELAKEFGLGSRARLYRAVRVCEGKDLDEVERAVALEVFLELLPDIWAGCEIGADERAVLSERVKSEVDGMNRLRTD